MKSVLILLLALLFLQPVLAINLTVEKLSEDEVMIIGLNDPATFDLAITNNDKTNDFSIYSFFGLGVEPKEKFEIKKGEIKEITLKVYPREDSKLNGFTTFSYFIQDKDKQEIEKKLKVNIIELGDSFEIGAESINPESNTIDLYLHNKVNFNFENLTVKFSSAFFDFERNLNIKPNQRVNFKVEVDQKEFDELMAGFYTLKANFKISDVESKLEEKINFLEKNILIESREDYGLIVQTSILKRTNKGNTMTESTTKIEKNIISRMFTTLSPEPTVVERDGFKITYYWDEILNPGETKEVKIKTNWLIPFVIILLIVLTVIFSKRYNKTDLFLRKRVSFVNAKGGEFALKIIINIEAKEFLEDVKIIDRLPPLVKIYGRFGGETPKRFHKSKKQFEWDLGDMEAGEKRVLSYIIYSKVGVLGKFALPSTFALFKREGKMKETNSNKAFFLAEQVQE